MKRIRPLEWVVIVGIILIVGAVLWPVTGGTPVPKATICRSNVKQSALGLLMYSYDADDRFPPRDLWMDASLPYVKSETNWHCPSVPKGAYGYAFNGALSLAKPPKDPAKTPLVYDSVNPIRNASDRVTSLPLPGRHGGGNSIAYADGHARRVASPASP